jgi:hypothetical protein
LVTVVNPGNPTGTYVPEPLLQVFLFWWKWWFRVVVFEIWFVADLKIDMLKWDSGVIAVHWPQYLWCWWSNQRISELCHNAGSWLVVDNTYEYVISP